MCQEFGEHSLVRGKIDSFFADFSSFFSKCLSDHAKHAPIGSNISKIPLLPNCRVNITRLKDVIT